MSSRYDGKSQDHAHYHGIGRIFGKAQLTRARLNIPDPSWLTDPRTIEEELLQELLDEIQSVEHDIDNREGEK